MVEIILYFLGFLVALMGLASFIKGAVSSGGKGKVKPTESTYTPPVVTLDDSEIKDLGHKVARWCTSWIYSSSANHKWLVIEVFVNRIKCAGLNKEEPFLGYPSLTVNFSKNVSPERVQPITQQLLEIISVECPEMINTYGLYKDGSFLILPTNSE